MNEPLHYLLLKLRSCDDYDDVALSLKPDYRVSRKKPLYIEACMDNAPTLAPKLYKRIYLESFDRHVFLLSCEPVADYREPGFWRPAGFVPPPKPEPETRGFLWLEKHLELGIIQDPLPGIVFCGSA